MWNTQVESQKGDSEPKVKAKYPCPWMNIEKSFAQGSMLLFSSSKLIRTYHILFSLSFDYHSLSILHPSESCKGWCCEWLRLVQKKHSEGAVICCAVSNIYYPDS